MFRLLFIELSAAVNVYHPLPTCTPSPFLFLFFSSGYYYRVSIGFIYTHTSIVSHVYFARLVHSTSLLFSAFSVCLPTSVIFRLEALLYGSNYHHAILTACSRFSESNCNPHPVTSLQYQSDRRQVLFPIVSNSQPPTSPERSQSFDEAGKFLTLKRAYLAVSPCLTLELI